MRWGEKKGREGERSEWVGKMCDEEVGSCMGGGGGGGGGGGYSIPQLLDTPAEVTHRQR